MSSNPQIRPKTVVVETRLDIRDLCSCAQYLKKHGQRQPTKSATIAEAVAMAAAYAENYGGVQRLSTIESREWLDQNGLGGSKENRGMKDLLEQISSEEKLSINRPMFGETSEPPTFDVLEVEEDNRRLL